MKKVNDTDTGGVSIVYNGRVKMWRRLRIFRISISKIIFKGANRLSFCMGGKNGNRMDRG